MLLDFQMPRKNGIQVVNEVRDLYKKLSEVQPVEEPYFVFLTAYFTLKFKEHLNEIGIAEIFEKPL